ncbi:MAG: phage major capsid protein [Candidatus Omnitrophica bacterium]|nr:phage major capsid protein [Candidatus Omnitrophota bacterium]
MNTVTIEEKLKQADLLFAEAKTILVNKDATAEEKGKVEKLMEDAKSLKAEAAKLQEIDNFSKEFLAAEEAKQEADKAKGERKDPKQFKDWKELLEAIFMANHRVPKMQKFDPRLQLFNDEKEPGHEEKVMTEGVGSAGGFLVPAEFMTELQSVTAELALVRGRASIIRMKRRQIGIPVLDQTTTTAGIPHWFGGMQFYWAEEAAEKTATNAKFREIQLVAHKLIGYTTASDELVADSAISLADFLSGPLGMAGGIAWMEDYSFIRGTGAGQPLGIINAGATISVARDATNPTYNDLCNMVENFLPSGRGVWFISQSLFSEMLQLAGPTANPSYVWGNAVAGVPNSLLGYPVVFTEKCPLRNNPGDVILADWRYYLIGDRQATTIESTQFDLWRYDKTSWRAVHRVDGQPWLSQPLYYEDGTTMISPFVILGAKSS